LRVCRKRNRTGGRTGAGDSASDTKDNKKMIKRNIVLMLSAVMILFTGCKEFWHDFWCDDPLHHMTEDDWEKMKSGNVGFEYFMARGFNLRFLGIHNIVQNIYDNSATYAFISDIALNVDEVFIVTDKDVITVADNKRAQTRGNYNPVFVNCDLNQLRLDFDPRTVLGIISASSGSDGKITKYGLGIISGTVYFRTNKGSHVFEFTIREGLFLLSAPAQYVMGGNSTIPLKGSEVERIIREGKEGVDYQLFTRDNITYVRIKNNLYERRYDTWTYAGVAEPFFLTSWTRRQTMIIFEILDWDEIVSPYDVFDRKGNRLGSRHHIGLGADYYVLAGVKDGAKIGGNVNDPNDITVTLMGCSK